MPEPAEFPPAFLQTLSEDDWHGILVERPGILNAEQCARLWRMTDRQSEPPQAIRILFERKAVMRWLRSRKRKKNLP